MTLLDPKIEKSFTACKFENFHPYPQLDIKSSNFVGIENLYMYIRVYKINCHQHSYGFENLMSSLRLGSKFSNLLQVGDFFFLGVKVHFLGECGA